MGNNLDFASRGEYDAVGITGSYGNWVALNEVPAVETRLERLFRENDVVMEYEYLPEDRRHSVLERRSVYIQFSRSRRRRPERPIAEQI